ncbi:MAG: acyl-homoserine-lactone synthase [Pseudomonadota bacterium]
MTTLVAGRANEHGVDWDLLDGMFRLRDEVFHKRLGWQVNSNNGLERDTFDELNPVYLIARAEGRRVRGCTRILPTTGPYMLKDVFADLLDGESAPQDDATWELSRFTADPDRSNPQASVGAISLGLMREAVIFADENDIERYVAVTSVAMERMLKRVGLPMIRLGSGKARWIGKVLTVACEIPIDDRTRVALFGGSENMERKAA